MVDRVDESNYRATLIISLAGRNTDDTNNQKPAQMAKINSIQCPP